MHEGSLLHLGSSYIGAGYRFQAFPSIVFFKGFFFVVVQEVPKSLFGDTFFLPGLSRGKLLGGGGGEGH